MRKFTGKMVAALLAGTLLFSSVPTVYGAEMDERWVTERGRNDFGGYR